MSGGLNTSGGGVEVNADGSVGPGSVAGIQDGQSAFPGHTFSSGGLSQSLVNSAGVAKLGAARGELDRTSVGMIPVSMVD